jgi:hypothetical protein
MINPSGTSGLSCAWCAHEKATWSSECAHSGGDHSRSATHREADQRARRDGLATCTQRDSSHAYGETVRRVHFLSEWYQAGRVTEMILLIRQTLRKYNGNKMLSARALDMSYPNLKLWLHKFELMDEAREILQASRRKFRLFAA